MSLILDGTNGLSDVDGSAATPAIRGTDTNTGIFFPAADTIAFSEGGAEAMRIDSSGNLGVGTASPTVRLHVSGSSNFTAGIESSNTFAILGFKASGTTGTIADPTVGIGGTGDALYMRAGGAERARIDSSGNLLVGTTTTRSRITALGTTATSPTLGTATGTALFCPNDNAYGTMFGSSNTGDGWIQQQRVDGTATAYNLILQPSGGNLLVGTTSGAGKVRIVGGAGTTPALYAANFNNTSGDYAAVLNLGSNSNNTSSLFLVCSEFGVANRFVIYGNGTYATVSDQRLKKNIETTRDGYLDDLMNLRVVKYNWNSQQDGEPKELGVIAQEVEQVFPSMVQESLADGASTSYKQVKTSILPFMLLKALQEQQAIIESQSVAIESLKARLDAANL